jgi:capsular exopolysaccharide synthesis family protein
MSNNNNNNRNGDMNDGGVREINLRDIFATLMRGKWIILIVTFLVFDFFLIKTLLEEPVYEAKTTVFVGGGQPAMPLGFLGDGRKNITNEIEILKSRNLARSVAEALIARRFLDEDQREVIPVIVNLSESGEFVSFATPEQVAGRIQRAMSFAQVPQTDIIDVRARSTNPREAALIADAYAQTYHERHFKGSRAHQRQVREFLETQKLERERALQEAEDRLQDYMERHGVVIMNAESQRVINQVAQLEAKREELAVQMDAQQNILESLRAQLAEHEPDVARSLTSADNPYIRRVQEQMAELQVQRDLAISQNPQSVGEDRYQARIRDIDEKIESLRMTLQRRTSEFIQDLSMGDEGYLRQLKQRIAEGQIELQGMQIQKSQTERLLREYESQFERLPGMNMQYARLERAKISNEKLYLMIEEKFNEAIIAEQSEFGSVNIIDDALVPNNPVSPNLQMNIAIGLFLGLGFGVGFVFLKEALSTKIRTPEDLKKENFVNLTTIAAMYNEVRRISKKGLVSIQGRIIDGYIITISSPLSPVAEAFRGLRTNLQYSQIDKPLKSVVVTSANPGEGKSTVATNLAVTYAQSEKRVLLIDGDLRKPTVHNILDLNKKPGLTNMLFDNIDLSAGIQKTVVDNLHVITSGDSLTNPADLLGSQKMKRLLTLLQEKYDVVIFDSPPVLAATDASILSTITDGVIIVTSSRKTKVDDIKVTRDSIEGVNGKILGTVLNNFDHRENYGSKYSYQYYQYGSYGKSANGHKKKSLLSK